MEQAADLINEGLGCRLFGHLDVPKVPGKFIMMTSDVQNVLMGLITSGGEMLKAY
jgi:hypothetical protein